MNYHYYQKEFPQEGISLSKSSKKGYPPHFHLHIELLYLISGSYAAIVDNQEYKMNPGDLLIIFPYQLHEYLDISGNNHEMVIKADPEILRDYEDFFDKKVPCCSLLRACDMTVECQETLKWLVKTHHSNMDVVALRKSLLNTIMWYFTNHVEFKDVTQTSLKALHKIVQYCNDHCLEQSFSLMSTSVALGYSYTYISHTISGKLNMSFSSYVNQLRIYHAIRLLRDTEDTITNIALICGYNTVRNFNDKFIKHTGKTPSEFRKEHSKIILKH